MTRPMPTLTPKQREEALRKASITRKERAELKAKLANGSITLKDALTKKKYVDNQALYNMRVIDVLRTQPGIGPAKATKIMAELDIAERKRLKGLGPRQRERLIDYAGENFSRA